VKKEHLSLETKVALELSGLLEPVLVGQALNVEPSSDLLYLLELYVPQMLSDSFPEWKQESLDGFFLASARKVSSNAAELVGLCILMSDQTVTPILMHLALAESHNSLASFQVFLGEPGGGHLRVSGPPCNSQRAHKLLDNLFARLDVICWSYTITNDALHVKSAAS
jgi:hypothetical protein